MTPKEIREKALKLAEFFCESDGIDSCTHLHEREVAKIAAALTAAHRQGREEQRKALEEIKKYASVIQKNTCAYGTTEGDGRTCDCKFAKGESLLGVSAETGGCAEARKIMWLIDSLLSQPDGSGGEKETV